VKPGRKSADELLASLIPGTRPPPPEELEPEQRAEWEAIVERLPADWFTGENIPMLRELCRHICYARELARQGGKVRAEIQAFMEGSAADTAGSIGTAERRKIQAGLRDELCKLLRSHGYQTERIGNLSTKLRLTKQSRYDASSAYRAAKDAGSTMKKPWLDWGENSSDRQQ
jgi:hypothetical protein